MAREVARMKTILAIVGLWLWHRLSWLPEPTYMDKCKRRRPNGPTPCLCCPAECVHPGD